MTQIRLLTDESQIPERFRNLGFRGYRDGEYPSGSVYDTSEGIHPNVTLDTSFVTLFAMLYDKTDNPSTERVEELYEAYLRGDTELQVEMIDTLHGDEPVIWDLNQGVSVVFRTKPDDDDQWNEPGSYLMSKHYFYIDTETGQAIVNLASLELDDFRASANFLKALSYVAEDNGCYSSRGSAPDLSPRLFQAVFPYDGSQHLVPPFSTDSQQVPLG